MRGHLDAVLVVILEAFIAGVMIENGNGHHFTIAQFALPGSGQTTLLGLPLGKGVTEIVAGDEYLNEFESLIFAEHSRRE